MDSTLQKFNTTNNSILCPNITADLHSSGPMTDKEMNFAHIGANSTLQKFKTIILDWTKDLSTTFPEYAYLWAKWSTPDISEYEIKELYNYCLTTYPERFFDILYQTQSLFDISNETNTCFLPGVEFKLLFNCSGISENTHKTMWKYLQLVLFSIVGSIQDKSKFGDSANMFDGLDETELHTKLQDAMTSMSDFFQNMTSTEQVATNESVPLDQSIPDADELHGHIKGLFNGKIGNLAKELAEEISGDMTELLGKDGEQMNSTADVLKNMMKNPTKITGLIKTVSDKLQQKISSGEISQDELMNEAMGLLGKMQGGGAEGLGGLGGLDFKSILKTLTKGMGKGMGNNAGEGGEGGMDFQEMFKNMACGMGGGMGKNTKIDTNALDRMSKKTSMQERLRNKMMQKKAIEEAANAAKQQMITTQIANYVPYDFEEDAKPKSNKKVFKIEGESQMTSSINAQKLDTILDESMKELNAVASQPKKKNKKDKK